VRDKTLTAGAKKIAEALISPGGQIAFARVVFRHIDWFDYAQERGLAWDQMIAVLHAAGVARPDGLPFTRGHVSSAVWRARKKASAARAKAAPPEEDRAARNLTRKERSNRSTAAPDRQPHGLAIDPGQDAVSVRVGTQGSGAGRATLDFMRRAAASRRGARAAD
jgi:hypothetical protein